MKKSKGRKRKHNTWQTPQKKITPLCCFFFPFFVQYGEIKANTGDVYFGLISGCFLSLQNKAAESR